MNHLLLLNLGTGDIILIALIILLLFGAKKNSRIDERNWEGYSKF
jgi:hypothetical protein